MVFNYFWVKTKIGRELSSAMYEPLLQGSSSSSNQNNMSECHVTNNNGEMFTEWAQAYSSSALFASINQVFDIFNQLLH